MRPGFERHLRKYSQAEKAIGKADTGKELKEIDQQLQRDLKLGAEKSFTTQHDQEAIYNLQEKKQAVMRRLKRDLAYLDDPEHAEERDPDRRFVTYEDGRYFIESDEGRSAVSLGEIMTDYEWGIEYQLDQQTVPRITRKEYLVELARAEIRDYLDQQILIEEIEGATRFAALPNRQDESARGGQNDEDGQKIAARHKATAYRGYRESMEQQPEYGGYAAEKMVRNFLKKISIDLQVDFDIIPADAYEDVAQKIDFIIKRKRRNRGVKVESPEEEDQQEEQSALGIQFTINTNVSVLHKKTRQVKRSVRQLSSEDRVDDIVLVAMSVRNVGKVVRTWKSQGRASGGPDKLWSGEVKERILRGLLQGIVSEDEMVEAVERMRS